jgi:hypothetical protein
MPMASPPLEMGEPEFLTFRTVTFWMMMLLASRMWMPSWSGVLLLARLHRAAWISVSVVARTVWPPAPPVVPPLRVAKPVAVPVAAWVRRVSTEQ